MITLTVVSYNGAPTETLSASFDELGGSIGRADTNQLVLPDPERSISRVHAQVVFRNGSYAIVDKGSNPVQVNGRPLGNGSEATVKDGDQVQIGGYALAVKVRSGKTIAGGASQPDDPFADLLGPGSFGSPAPAPAARAGGGASSSVDPLAGFGFSPSPPAADPFGFNAPAPAAAKGSSAPAAGGIPDDWDPFAPDPVSSKQAAGDLARNLGSRNDFGLDVGAAAPAALIPDLPSGGGGSDSIDNLFGLGAPSGGNPLANSVLDDPLARPNMAVGNDPLKSLNSAARASATAAPDNVSELNAPFIPEAFSASPVTSSLPPAPTAARVVTPAAPPKAGLPGGAVLSWGDDGGESRTVIRPSSPRSSPRAPGRSEMGGDTVPAAFVPTAPEVDFALPSANAPLDAIPPAPRPAPAPAAAPRPTAAAVAHGADVHALLAAFREGLATPTVQLDALTPELMRLVGQLLHESTRGTVELLVARAALKREIRAEVTMIVAKENNPLKFSPSVEVALGHLLSPPARGFMPAASAMRDAYDDLRAHQFGFVAGMRAALEGLLKRFDPVQLEGKLTQKSVLSSILPGSRKARMWEVFQELYAQISEEAAEDFHELFGKAFLQAYEAHIDELKSRE